MMKVGSCLSKGEMLTWIESADHEVILIEGSFYILFLKGVNFSDVVDCWGVYCVPGCKYIL